MPVQLREEHALTIDVSVEGVLIEARNSRSIGEPIEFSMIFDRTGSSPLRISCTGKVIRVEPRGSLFGLAAEIEKFTFAGFAGKPERDH